MLDFTKYIEFQKGNIPLVLSVPHGGRLEFNNIPRRTKGILGVDGRTISITKKFISLLKDKFKEHDSEVRIPSYVISMVPRSKIDINRKEEDAFVQDSIDAKEIYRFYHNKIKEFIFDNIKQFGRSLLIDIHGFEKNKRPPGYPDVDIILGTNNLTSFFSTRVPRKNWVHSLRGKIIQSFLDLKVPIAPSHPKRREYALTGGYITKMYGASQIPRSQAMQIEFSDRIRIYDEKLREMVSNLLVNILYEDIKNDVI
ncbi:MAG: hypothetical protein ACFFBI_01320 [Promethearchaeota archaeon]